MMTKIVWIKLGNNHSFEGMTSLLEKHTDESIVIRSSSLGLSDISGLIITGDDPDLEDPASIYDLKSIDFVKRSLSNDIPIIATGYGMGLLNICFDGGHLTSVVNHRIGSITHSHKVYVSPGSKSAAILGIGGFFSLNSRHKLGLREQQRSPRLLAAAYSVDDGIIEGIESTEHSWVIGYQANLENSEETPKVFGNIFVAFVERAVSFHKLHCKS